MNLILQKKHYFLYGIAFFPLLPKGIESVLMGILFLLFLFDYKKTARRINIRHFVLLTTIPLLYILSALYSQNIEQSIQSVITVLPMIIFSYVLASCKARNIKINIRVLFYIYILSLLLNTLLTQLQIYFTNNKNLSDWEYRQIFESHTRVHGTYYSLWISFAVLVLFLFFLELFKKKQFKWLFPVSILIIYFIYIQMLLGARMPLFSVLLVLTLFGLFSIKNKRSVLFIIITVFLVGSTSVIFKPNFYNRILTLKDYSLDMPEGDYHIKQGAISNTQIRNGIYYCSFLIVKENFIFGVGIGDTQDALDSCYKNEIPSNVYEVFQFNTHNQYLQTLISNGLIGLFLMIVSYCCLIVIKKRSKLYLMFFILVALSMFTENILNRHDGVLFFGLFNTLLFYSNTKIFKL